MTNIQSIVPDESRHNFYHAIHKALRLGHCRMLAALGSNDYMNQMQTETMLADLRGLLALAAGHLEGENREIHAALEERAPGASAHAAEDHEDHERSFAELESLIRAVETATKAGRESAGRALYRRYAIFAAHDIEHMNEEETALLAVLQDRFSDDELREIEHRIVSAIPPQKMAAYMALMAPALNHGERVELLAKLQKAMPEPVFRGLLSDTIKPSLPANDYAAVIGELMMRAA
ncbi:hypothetical protein [Aestuariivirga sp.]|uniref:hypothetical protein n=1 Tax=Aestuariivirga sp. TaxID=2650926 RepID=UPI0035938CC4